MRRSLTFVMPLALVTAGGLLLGACADQSSGSLPVSASVPGEAETSAPGGPAETVPAADEFSQVVGGTLYQGTEKAPVRINTDTPGQPPAAEAGAPDYATDPEGMVGYAASADKYLVLVMGTYTDGVGGTMGGTLKGYGWSAYQQNAYGNFRGLNQQGITSGDPYPTAEAAAAGPFTVDGRTLDRSEYIMQVVPPVQE